MHPIFSLPEVSIVNVRPDPMHMLDLGIAHNVLGNVLSILCYFSDHFPGPINPTDVAKPFGARHDFNNGTDANRFTNCN